jgi:hypothetical protein
MRFPKKTFVWLLVFCCVVASVGLFKHYWTPPWVISDLSMRFTHPELYESRDGLPMYTALYEFRRRGLLHRGMAAIEIRKLLGEPPEKSEHQTSNDSPNILWFYSLHASSLTVEFSPDGTALSFTERLQGDKPRQDETW